MLLEHPKRRAWDRLRLLGKPRVPPAPESPLFSKEIPPQPGFGNSSRTVPQFPQLWQGLGCGHRPFSFSRRPQGCSQLGLRHRFPLWGQTLLLWELHRCCSSPAWPRITRILGRGGTRGSLWDPSRSPLTQRSPRGSVPGLWAPIPWNTLLLWHWMLSLLEGLVGDPTPRVPPQTGPQQVGGTRSHPGAAQGPSQEHPRSEASLRWHLRATLCHLVPPPRGFVFPGRSILIPATSRSHPRAQPASPLSRGGSGIQHSLFPSVSLRPPPLPPSSLSPSLPSSFFFFFPDKK